MAEERDLVDVVLTNLGLENYIPTFRANNIDGETLLILTNEFIKELIPPLRERMRLVQKIAELNKINDSIIIGPLDFNVEQQRPATPPLPPTVENSNSVSEGKNGDSEAGNNLLLRISDVVNNGLDFNVEQQDQQPRAETSSPATKENPNSVSQAKNGDKELDKNIGNKLLLRISDLVNTFDLPSFLNSKNLGRIIQTEYKANEELSLTGQLDLVELIVDHFLDIGLSLTNDELEILNFKIEETFPNESHLNYYTAPTEHKQGRKIIKSIASGKLVDKLRNRKHKKRILEKTEEADSEERNEEYTEDQLNSKKWLRNNLEPIIDVLYHWEKTSPLRTNAKTNTVELVLRDWPHLKLPNGFQLVEKDFISRFKDAEMRLYSDFDSFFDLLYEKCILPKKNREQDKVLKGLITSLNSLESTDEEKDFAKFSLIVYAVPPKGRVPAPVFWKPTTAESAEGFLCVLQDPADLTQKIRDVNQLCSEKKVSMQPFVITCPSLNYKTNYVIIDDAKYQFGSLRKSIDVCFKFFFGLNVEFPVQSRQIWQLLQQGVYKLPLEKGLQKPIPAVEGVLKKINIKKGNKK